MKNDDKRSTVSSRRLEANRRNAQKSTGPRTDAGKAKSSANSYKHGFFSSRLFRDAAQRAKEEPEYLAILDGFHEHYKPVGFFENFWVERAAAEAFRYARNLEHEQLACRAAVNYMTVAPSNLQRYQASINKGLAQCMTVLQNLQAARKAAEAPEAPEVENQPDTAEATDGRISLSLSTTDEEPAPDADETIVETNPTDSQAAIRKGEIVETNPPQVAPEQGLSNPEDCER
jgi:hypothetical protein